MSNRVDNRSINQKVADANWQPVRKPNNQSPLERAIDEREGKPSRTLHGDKLALHLLKQEQRKRDEEFDQAERKREHLERYRSQLIRLQTLREKYEENPNIPQEFIVKVDQAIAQVSDPDGCADTAKDMYLTCFAVEQHRQDEIAKGIAHRRSQLEAELEELRSYQIPAEIADTPTTKVRLNSTELNEQAEELFRTLCESTEHSFDETCEVYDALKAHRAGNSAPIAAMLNRYTGANEVEEAADAGDSQE